MASLVAFWDPISSEVVAHSGATLKYFESELVQKWSIPLHHISSSFIIFSSSFIIFHHISSYVIHLKNKSMWIFCSSFSLKYCPCFNGHISTFSDTATGISLNAVTCDASPGRNCCKGDVTHSACPHLPRAVRVKKGSSVTTWTATCPGFFFKISSCECHCSFHHFHPSKSASSFGGVDTWGYQGRANIWVWGLPMSRYTLAPWFPLAKWLQTLQRSKERKTSQNRALWYSTMHYGLWSFHLQDNLKNLKI